VRFAHHLLTGQRPVRMVCGTSGPALLAQKRGRKRLDLATLGRVNRAIFRVLRTARSPGCNGKPAIDIGELLNILPWRALSLALSSDIIVRGMSERAAASERIGWGGMWRGAVLWCGPGGRTGEARLSGSAWALSERREDIPHRSTQRAEGVQFSATLVVLRATSFRTKTTQISRATSTGNEQTVQFPTPRSGEYSTGRYSV